MHDPEEASSYTSSTILVEEGPQLAIKLRAGTNTDTGSRESWRASISHKKTTPGDVARLIEDKVWKDSNWVEIVCEVLFHIKRRETTISMEIYTGVIQFISCMYILPVMPLQLERAGYDLQSTYVTTVISPLPLDYLR